MLSFSTGARCCFGSLFTGFYREALANLRAPLEGLLTGAYFRAYPNDDLFHSWAEGEREGKLWISSVRRDLQRAEPYSLFERRGSEDFALIGERGGTGWAGLLYENLSAFVHGRPQTVDDAGREIPTTNVGLWGGSNGPVYEYRSFRLWRTYFFAVTLVCGLLWAMAEPGMLRAKRSEVGLLSFIDSVSNVSGSAVPTVVERAKQYLNDRP